MIFAVYQILSLRALLIQKDVKLNLIFSLSHLCLRALLIQKDVKRHFAMPGYR